MTTVPARLDVLLTADPFLPVPPILYGGIERIVDGLAKELRARGCRVGLVAHRDSTCEVDFFSPWPSESTNSALDAARHALGMAAAIRAFRPNVVHSFSRLILLAPHLPRRIAKVMSYQRATGGWRNALAARLGNASFAFTGCSEFIAAQGRLAGGSWTAIPNFVDVDRYHFVEHVQRDAPLVFLSRIERIKGAHTAIEMARASGRSLLVAGNRVESPEGRAYWNQEIEPQLGKNGIEYVGPVDDAAKDRLLGSAAALVVPVEWDEPFGIVFAEAQACGTPVISCPRGALPEIIAHGVHGFLVRSVAEGVEAISRLDSLNRRACRINAETRFSREVVASTYLDLYRRLLASVRT